jgi:simple sugar transport system permease protein
VSDAVSLAFATLRTATPLLYASSGGCVSERGGIVNIALEGMLLVGAFASISAAAVTGSPIAGVAAAVLAGVALAGIHAAVTIHWKIDQIVSGVALNLLATGLTKLCLALQFGSASNSGRVAAAEVPNYMVERGGIDLLALGALLAPFVAHVLLERTRFGLRLRAAGEHPDAATTLGIPVGRVRAAGVLVSGALASLGGAWLAYGQHQFVADMSGGRGFIALAAVIFGGWKPLRALLACLLFGGLEAWTFRLEGDPSFRDFHELVEVLPYVATLLLLATAVLRSRAPAALGKPTS